MKNDIAAFAQLLPVYGDMDNVRENFESALQLGDVNIEHGRILTVRSQWIIYKFPGDETAARYRCPGEEPKPPSIPQFAQTREVPNRLPKVPKWSQTKTRTKQNTY